MARREAGNIYLFIYLPKIQTLQKRLKTTQGKLRYRAAQCTMREASVLDGFYRKVG